MADQTHSPTASQIKQGLSLATDASHDIVVPRLKLALTDVTPHFAPGPTIYADGDRSQEAPGEKCTIAYEITDPWSQLKDARLEIARKADPKGVVAKIPLSEDLAKPGKHTLEWDGKCTEKAVAGRYIHVLHSPYTITVVGTGPQGELRSDPRETAVLLEKLLLQRGPDVTTAQPPAAGTNAYYQDKLISLGYHVGPIDGAIGKTSARGIKDFQRGHAGLRVTGALDQYTKAYLDGVAPAKGVARYQFILNAIGFRCGAIDGLVGKKTRRAVRAYRAQAGLPPGDALDGPCMGLLDVEALPALQRREVLEGDRGVAAVRDNPFPAPGAEKKVFIDCDGCYSPGSLPYNQKHKAERDNLVRPHFPAVVTPLVKKSDGSAVFAPAAVGPLRIDFSVDPVAPPADLGIPNAVTRACVNTVMTKDGDEATTGHHAHELRGGVRSGAQAGVFLLGKRYVPYELRLEAAKYACECFTAKPDDAALGTAGAYFMPSTIAGDRFTLVAAVDPAGFDEPPASDLAVKTGTMIVWRRYHVAKLWLMQYAARPHRTETQPQLGLVSWYAPAFVEFVEPVAPTRQLVQPRTADHQEIDLALYTEILREAGYAPGQLSAAQIQTRFAGKILWPLQPAAHYDPLDEQGYYDAIDSEITAFEERFATTLRALSDLEADPGLVVLVFHDNAPTAGNDGIHAITDPNLQSWGWSLLASQRVVHLIDDQDTAPGAIDGETLAHEVGHSLWLHHASTSAGSDPSAANKPEHNQPEWKTCTMSYVALADFCGHCVLKLRGWDEEKLA